MANLVRDIIRIKQENRKRYSLEVMPQVYQLNLGWSNIFLLVEENDITLVDTGTRGKAQEILDFVHQLGYPPSKITRIILTHFHSDHTGSLAELEKLTQSKVYAHTLDAPYITGKYFRSSSARFFSLIYKFVWQLKPAEVDVFLNGGEKLNLLGGLEIIHTPGHTLGNISLFFPKKKLLIAGDTITKRGKKLYLPPKEPFLKSSRNQVSNSVQKLAQLEFETLCLGHGRPLFGNASKEVQRLANYLLK